VLVSTVGPGQGKVLIAGDAGTLAGAVVTAVNSWINARKPNNIAGPAGGDMVFSATSQAVNVTADCYVYSTYTAAYTAAADAELDAMFELIPINAKCYTSAIIEALMLPEGVRNVVLSAPAADVTPAADCVCTKGVVTLTVHSL
jgi:phage-related baseplate assembly protein